MKSKITIYRAYLEVYCLDRIQINYKTSFGLEAWQQLQSVEKDDGTQSLNFLHHANNADEGARQIEKCVIWKVIAHWTKIYLLTHNNSNSGLLSAI